MFFLKKKQVFLRTRLTIGRTETKDRGIYPLDVQINRISISMLSMSALFFSNFSMFNYVRKMICYCQMIEWEKEMKDIRP